VIDDRNSVEVSHSADYLQKSVLFHKDVFYVIHILFSKYVLKSGCFHTGWELWKSCRNLAKNRERTEKINCQFGRVFRVFMLVLFLCLQQRQFVDVHSLYSVILSFVYQSHCLSTAVMLR